jgi:cation diffusion facilitator CzcD-associated flavoprotein CzcO
MPVTLTNSSDEGLARKAVRPPTFGALIIGAGVAGLYQLYRLRDRRGVSVQVLEAADGVGGTWYR